MPGNKSCKLCVSALSKLNNTFVVCAQIVQNGSVQLQMSAATGSRWASCSQVSSTQFVSLSPMARPEEYQSNKTLELMAQVKHRCSNLCHISK